MHFCLKLGITYIKLGFSAHDMQIRIAKIGIARAMWNFGVGISARAKFWLSPGIEFWLLIFRRLPVFFKKKRLPLFRNRLPPEPFLGQKKFPAPLARGVKNDL